MADPVSLVLGILPLVVEACKAYKTVYGKFKVFSHYSREVQRILKKVKLQRQLFVLETQLLLQLADPDIEDLTTVMKNGCDQGWINAEVEDKLRDNLKDNYSCCIDVVEDIKETLEGLRTELKAFDDLAVHKNQGEMLKDAVRRLRNSTKITFEKSKYEKHITDLREHNDLLRTMRCQLVELGKPSHQVVTHRKKPMPNFVAVREASEKLHDSLSSSWCCSDWTHSGHSIKLCLEAQRASGKVCLDIIVCFENTASSNPVILMQPVRHLTVEAIFPDDSSPLEPMSVNSCLPACSATPNPSLPKTPKSFSPFHDRQTRRLSIDERPAKKKVRFSGCEDQSYSALTSPHAFISMPRQENICQNLLNGACSPFSKSSRCPGLLETCHGSFRHVFHSSSNCLGGLCNTEISIPATETLSLRDAIQKPRDEIISMNNQLRLARRIVLGVLQFHSTSWLSDQWGPSSLSFFSKEMELSDQVLSTLHLARSMSLHPPAPLPSLPSDLSMGGVDGDSQAALEEARLMYGISNITLYSLGVTLLAIGYWTLFDPNDVVAVRKLVEASHTRPPISLRYRDLARKCLECDFGFGKDLTKESLRQAVYDNVVNELEELIELTGQMDLRKP